VTYSAFSLLLVLLLRPNLASAEIKRERFQNAEVTYDWVVDNRGQKLRTFITRPRLPMGKFQSFSSYAG
jgi:hypothetical protein